MIGSVAATAAVKLNLASADVAIVAVDRGPVTRAIRECIDIDERRSATGIAPPPREICKPFGEHAGK
jgi:hypothetical protein